VVFTLTLVEMSSTKNELIAEEAKLSATVPACNVIVVVGFSSVVLAPVGRENLTLRYKFKL
jgi:hypothetical protein